MSHHGISPPMLVAVLGLVLAFAVTCSDDDVDVPAVASPQLIPEEVESLFGEWLCPGNPFLLDALDVAVVSTYAPAQEAWTISTSTRSSRTPSSAVERLRELAVGHPAFTAREPQMIFVPVNEQARELLRLRRSSAC